MANGAEVRFTSPIMILAVTKTSPIAELKAVPVLVTVIAAPVVDDSLILVALLSQPRSYFLPHLKSAQSTLRNQMVFVRQNTRLYSVL
jgi:hypothetical protein